MDVKKRAIEEYWKAQEELRKRNHELECCLIEDAISLFSIKFDWNGKANILSVDSRNRVVHLQVEGIGFVVDEYFVYHAESQRRVSDFAGLGELLLDK